MVAPYKALLSLSDFPTVTMGEGLVGSKSGNREHRTESLHSQYGNSFSGALPSLRRILSLLFKNL